MEDKWIQRSTLSAGLQTAMMYLLSWFCGLAGLSCVVPLHMRSWNCSYGCISWDLSWGQNVQDDPHPPGPLFKCLNIQQAILLLACKREQEDKAQGPHCAPSACIIHTISQWISKSCGQTQSQNRKDLPNV